MVKRKDLVDIIDDDYQQRQNEFMQCRNCGFGFGGTRGDYFAMAMDDVFTCGECGSKDIALVKEMRTIVEV